MYVKMRFIDICDNCSVDPDGSVWPEEGKVEKLVQLSSGLFQWASVAMTHIGAKSPRTRLDEIIDDPTTYTGLDNLYQGVLASAFPGETQAYILRLLQDVLGTILVAVTPIDLNTLAYLCCDKIDDIPKTTALIRGEILSSLRSLLLVPKHPDQPITVAHPSVIDFLTDLLRCPNKLFYIDIIDHHTRLLSACFSHMERDLKQDICEIRNGSRSNEDVQDEVAERIPSGLRYACQYWGTHLVQCGHGTSVELCPRLAAFSRKHLLHWLEVMSLIRVMASALSVAREVGHWLSGCTPLSPTDVATQRLWSDTGRFVVVYFKIISNFAAQIYRSALRLAPSETELARQFSGRVRGLRVLRGLAEKHWPAAVWTAGGHKKKVRCVAFSSDGRTIATGSDDSTLRLWDADSGASKAEPLVGHTKGVSCLAFAPGGRVIASGSDDHTLRLWDAYSGASKAEPLAGHTEAVSCLSFSPDGRMIASGSWDHTLRLWDANLGASKGGPLVGHTSMVSCLSFSPDSRKVASGSWDRTLRLWDAGLGASMAEPLVGHTSMVSCLSFSPDGRMIASGSYDRTLRLWDADSSASMMDSLVGHAGVVSCLAFSPDGRMIASGSWDRTLRLWDADSGDSKANPLVGHTTSVNCLSFSPDGRMIVSGSWDKTLRLWDAYTGASKAEPLVGHTDIVTCLSFSPDGRKIASGSVDKILRMWDADSGASKVEPLGGHTKAVSCLAFSPSGRVIASASEDHTLRLWDAESGASKAEPLVGVPSHLWRISFSPDGRTVTALSTMGSSRRFDLTGHGSLNSGSMAVAADELCPPAKPTFEGAVEHGWVYYGGIRWFWLPISGPSAQWLGCGRRLVVRSKDEVWIIDVSEVVYAAK